MFQLALVISIHWQEQNTEDTEDHYDSDNRLTLEEREYRRQWDTQDATYNAERMPARRAEIYQNNCYYHRERQERRERVADVILPIYKRYNTTPPDYDSTTSRRSTPIPLTGNETWGDLIDTIQIARLNIQQRADALELALVDSY
jgi:hypothetical protein